MKIRNKKKIANIFLFNMILVVGLVVIIVTSLWISELYKRFHTDAEKIRADYELSQKRIIKDQVGYVIEAIEYQRMTTEENLKIDIKERTYEAYSIAVNIYERNVGKKSDEEIEKMICDALKPVRFNKGRGILFC